MKRQRGRGRKPSNPANRSYESNGPEVKIRGNATQIYDKYLQLARDASSAGDRVRAENLYQHAEHYYRIIQANQPKRDPNQDENAEGTENASAEGENQQGGDEQQRRGRGRGRGRDRDRDRQPRDGQDASETNAQDGEKPEGGETAAADGDSDEGASRRRTRRPRRPRNEGEMDGNAAAEQALESASESADREPDGTGGDPSESAAA